MTRGRRGFTLAEALAALGIVALAVVAAAGTVAWSRRVAARCERRAVALDLAASVAERLRATAYADVVAGELRPDEVPPTALPDARLRLEVDEDEALGLKRVTIEVRWGGREPGRLALATAVGESEPYR